MRHKLVLSAALWLAACLPALAAPPDLSALAAVLVDGHTGQVLYARNPHMRLPMASTTKITTGILAIEHGGLDDEVAASRLASDTTGSSIYLMPGEKLTTEQLLYGMLLVSGNDAAIDLAQHTAGSIPAFVHEMNQKARELGMVDTHYANPDGLPAPDHYTSAYDLAVMARYALSNPTFAKITDTRMIQLPGNARMPFRIFINHNRLLRDFPGAMGGKTGYTIKAGPCFVGSAERNGRYVIETLLDAPTMWADARALLTYGLDDFRNQPAVAPGEILGQVSVKDGTRDTVAATLPAGLTISVPVDDPTPIRRQVTLASDLQAPIAANQTVGQLLVYQGDRLLLQTPLQAKLAVPYLAPGLKLLLEGLKLLAIGFMLLAGGLGSLRIYVRWHRQKLKRRIKTVASR